MAKKILSKLQLNVIFRSEQEGGFTVIVPSLPGCITYGTNLEEATRMAHEAIGLYIEDLIADKEPIPLDAQSYLTKMEVALPSAQHITHD